MFNNFRQKLTKMTKNKNNIYVNMNLKIDKLFNQIIDD